MFRWEVMLYMFDLVNHILSDVLEQRERDQLSTARHQIPEENQDRCHVSSAWPPLRLHSRLLLFSNVP